MAEHSTPHFHNQPGVAAIRTSAREFMCIGALPPFDHPHIFIDMGGDSEAICSYCSTRFVYDPSVKTGCEPAECAFAAEGAH
ncbi:MAG: zinc-finger domain-containing protein [Alphaproteobacteria bacterium]|nr:zinc-finger domain-containing protein [Alphaproteobacteria bacterium]